VPFCDFAQSPDFALARPSVPSPRLYVSSAVALHHHSRSLCPFPWALTRRGVPCLIVRFGSTLHAHVLRPRAPPPFSTIQHTTNNRHRCGSNNPSHADILPFRTTSIPTPARPRPTRKSRLRLLHCRRNRAQQNRISDHSFRLVLPSRLRPPQYTSACGTGSDQYRTFVSSLNAHSTNWRCLRIRRRLFGSLSHTPSPFSESGKSHFGREVRALHSPVVPSTFCGCRGSPLLCLRGSSCKDRAHSEIVRALGVSRSDSPVRENSLEPHLLGMYIARQTSCDNICFPAILSSIRST
jgi:hypothetical protein